MFEASILQYHRIVFEFDYCILLRIQFPIERCVWFQNRMMRPQNTIRETCSGRSCSKCKSENEYGLRGLLYLEQEKYPACIVEQFFTLNYMLYEIGILRSRSVRSLDGAILQFTRIRS